MFDLNAHNVSSAKYFEITAAPFKGSAACFEINDRPSLLIKRHIKSF